MNFLDLKDLLNKHHEDEAKRVHILSFYATHIESWRFFKRVRNTEEYKQSRDYRLLTEAWKKNIKSSKDLPFNKHHWRKDGIRSERIWKQISELQGTPNDLKNIIRQMEKDSFIMELAATMKAVESQRRHTYLKDFLTSGVSLMAFSLAIFAVLLQQCGIRERVVSEAAVLEYACNDILLLLAQV